MSINQLGYMNFPDLSQYVLEAADLALWESFRQAFQSEMVGDLFTSGVLYFTGNPAYSGLSVTIPAGFVIFPDGHFAAFAAQTVAIAPGDGTHYRQDRVVLGYSENNDEQVVNLAGLTKTLDKDLVAAVSIVQGANFASSGASVPSAIPSNGVSVMIIPVAPTDSSINTANVSQADDTACQFAAQKFGDANHLIRYNRSLGVLQFSNNGGTLWQALTGDAIPPFKMALTNDNAAHSITGLVFSSASVDSAVVDYSVYADSSAGEVHQVGQVRVWWNPVADSWEIDSNYSGDDCMVSFAVGATSGQMTYQSNLSGTGYSGTLRIGRIRALAQ